MGKKIEGYWDCPQCGSKANKGRYRNCPNCGRPRGSGTRFYMIEKDNFVPESVVPKGPDWFCECCESYNTFSAQYCTSCGAPKGASKDYFEVRKEEEARKSSPQPSLSSFTSSTPDQSESHYFRSETTSSQTHRSTGRESESHHDEDEDDHGYSSSFSKVTTTPRSNPYSSAGSSSYSSYHANRSSSFSLFSGIGEFLSKHFIAIISVLVAIVLLGGLIYLFIPKDATLHVTKLSWQRSIEIEEYKTVRESDWSVPAGGRTVYTNREIRYYERVLDHYETRQELRSETYISGYTTYHSYTDLGNGYFDDNTYEVPEYSTRYWYETVEDPVYRNEPVYDTKYYYDIERWVYCRSVYSSGTTGEAGIEESVPYWPEYNLAANERSSTKHGTYVVSAYNVKDKNQATKEYKTSLELWQQIKINSEYTFTISLGNITEIKELE